MRYAAPLKLRRSLEGPSGECRAPSTVVASGKALGEAIATVIGTADAVARNAASRVDAESASGWPRYTPAVDDRSPGVIGGRRAAGIRDLGVGLVVTVGPDEDPAAFGPQPPRVVVERYIPQTQLLPACDVIASHAGSGTVLGALALGTPQLCLPQAADQCLNVAAAARAGAGLPIPAEQMDAASVADAIRRLLDDNSV